MNSKYIYVGLVAVLVIALGAYWFPKGSTPSVGALVSPDVYDNLRLHEDAEIGGGNLATSSIGAATYTAAQVFNNKLITHTAASALTVTLPASSTVSQIKETSMTHTLYLAPVTTNITVAGGTGVDLNIGSSTAVCLAGGVCRLDFVRKANTDIEVLFNGPFKY